MGSCPDTDIDPKFLQKEKKIQFSIDVVSADFYPYIYIYIYRYK